MNHAFQMMLSRYGEAESIDQLRGALLKYLRFTGFHQYAYYTYNAGPRRNNPLLISNYSPEWIAYYMSNSYAQNDPVFDEAEKSLTPFTWSSDAPKKEWNKKNIKVLNEARDAKILHGVSVPFQIFNGRSGAMTFASDLPMNEFIDVYQNARNELCLAAIYFHASAQALAFRKTSTRIHLTEREYEVLYQCVCGLEANDIALKLDISVATVRAHMRNINIKYKTKSIRNACIMALANLDVDLPTEQLIGLHIDIK